MEQSSNVLFIMSDEHTRHILGCYGHPLVKTPNLDRLAARGVRFTNAYTASPMCIPTRAAMATGRYCHEISNWDSAHPYTGAPRSWMHDLRDQGHHIISIGKLHYQGLPDDDHGHSEERLPLYAHEHVGWRQGLLRKEHPDLDFTTEYSQQIGWGDSSYTDYDLQITAESCRWLREEADAHSDKPWALFTSLVSPHYPLIAPEKYQHLYPEEKMPLPQHPLERGQHHPAVAHVRDIFNYDDHFDDGLTRKGIAAYLGLCTFLDEQVGLILDALDGAGLTEQTTIIYTSDHGDSLGEHGFWAKSTMYEHSAGIPLIMAGPGLPAGHTVRTAAAFVDFAPTITSLVGAESNLPYSGRSLLDFVANEEMDRPVLCEYHDGGSISSTFMLRYSRWKYIYHVGFRPELYDIEADPLERTDLGEDPAYEAVRQQSAVILREILDPEAVDAQCFREQAERVEFLGGREAILNHGTFGFTPIPKK